MQCVTAWCAVENTGSRKVLEKAGMQLVRTEKNGIKTGDKLCDKLIYEINTGDIGREGANGIRSI
jgi:ribosomal-protein-alanine N-acetyltransferase